MCKQKRKEGWSALLVEITSFMGAALKTLRPCLTRGLRDSFCYGIVDKSMHLSKLFYFYLKIKSSSTWFILLPSAKGLSFTFMLSHHPFLEHLLESITVILSVMCLSQNAVNCGIILMLLSLIFLLLVFTWNSEVPWHLCFAPQLRASEIPLYHALLWSLEVPWHLCFAPQSCWSL